MSAASEPTAMTATTEQSFRYRRAAWLWGSFVVAFLGGQVAMGVVAVILATGDPSFAVVPDYHEKAMHWDDSTRRQTQSDNLHWTASTRLSGAADALGQRMLVVTLTSDENEPIGDAVVDIRAFHHARAGTPTEVTLRSHHDGHYSAAIPMERDGLWQIEMSAARGDDRFLLSQTIDTQVGQP